MNKLYLFSFLGALCACSNAEKDREPECRDSLKLLNVDESVRYTLWCNDEPILSGFIDERWSCLPVKQGGNKLRIQMEEISLRDPDLDITTIFNYKYDGNKVAFAESYLKIGSGAIDVEKTFNLEKVVHKFNRDLAPNLDLKEVQKAFEKVIRSFQAATPSEFEQYYSFYPDQDGLRKEFDYVFQSSIEKKLVVNEWEVLTGNKYALVRPVNDRSNNEKQPLLMRVVSEEAGQPIERYACSCILMSKRHDGKWLIWNRDGTTLDLK